MSRNKNNNLYPCKPQFYYIKGGLRGSTLYGHVFVMFLKGLRVQESDQEVTQSCLPFVDVGKSTQCIQSPKYRLYTVHMKTSMLWISIGTVTFRLGHLRWSCHSPRHGQCFFGHTCMQTAVTDQTAQTHSLIRVVLVFLDTTTVDSRYLEFQGTHWNTSRYPYLDISEVREWGKQ